MLTMWMVVGGVTVLLMLFHHRKSSLKSRMDVITDRNESICSAHGHGVVHISYTYH